ncbi:MAG: MmgE/PrpD family protein [Actinomycetota bacterium]|nr:MmgE/PrpD family protein [Actinomycetota bacterium]
MRADVAGIRDAIERLGSFAADFSLTDLGKPTLASLRKVLHDSLAVLVSGGLLPESRAIANALPAPDGRSSVFGSAKRFGVVDAAWLNGTAMVALELDEGNKSIRGHASAHVLPAVLALAEELGAGAPEALSAFVAGHEVASRFGAAVRLKPGVHPHGNWGAVGAAAAAAKLMGADAQGIAAAIDNAGALALATPFSVATNGMWIRNAWVGASNASGIWAAAVAAGSGNTPIFAPAAESLGGILGDIDAQVLLDGLARSWFLDSGYFKIHSSCSYTHPAADLALGIFAERGEVRSEDLDSILVETHHLGAGLRSLEWPTRLAAMFSIPCVVATALGVGHCLPVDFGLEQRSLQERHDLAAKVEVAHNPEFDRELPARRMTRMTIIWKSGEKTVLEAENPVGDSAYRPLDQGAIEAKAERLLGPELAARASEATELLLSGGTPVRGSLSGLRAAAALAAENLEV